MKKQEKIRVLIVDDHYIVRMGLISVVDTEPDMEVVAEADDGDRALELYAKHHPDLVLLDLRMPGILMLSAFSGSEDIHRAIQAGVQGYVLKSSSGENLIPALRAVAAGQRWITKEIVTQLDSRKSTEELTTREVQVLNQLARGLANKTIADILNISEYTVKDHLKHILFKLRVADRTEAVTTAIQRGIIHI
jgi:DNA-binding NarL/FixJ family response regulator